MPNLERKEVPHEIGGCYFEGDKVVDLIEELKNRVKTYGEGLYIDKVYGSYGDSDYLAFFVMQPETDDQMATRIRREEEAEANSRAWELRQYEALKAKYGDKLA